MEKNHNLHLSIHKWHRAPILIIALCIFLTKQCDFLKDDTIPVILSMNDIGYDVNIVEDIDRRELSRGVKRYNLRISNSEDHYSDEYEFLDISIFEAPDTEKANSIYDNKMIEIKNREKSWLHGCTDTCFKLSKEDIDFEEEFFVLDNDEWNSDKAYALYRLNEDSDNHYYHNFIFVIKDNRAVFLEFNQDFEIDDNMISTLKDLLFCDVFE